MTLAPPATLTRTSIEISHSLLPKYLTLLRLTCKDVAHFFPLRHLVLATLNRTANTITFHASCLDINTIITLPATIDTDPATPSELSFYVDIEQLVNGAGKATSIRIEHSVNDTCLIMPHLTTRITPAYTAWETGDFPHAPPIPTALQMGTVDARALGTAVSAVRPFVLDNSSRPAMETAGWWWNPSMHSHNVYATNGSMLGYATLPVAGLTRLPAFTMVFQEAITGQLLKTIAYIAQPNAVTLGWWQDAIRAEPDTLVLLETDGCRCILRAMHDNVKFFPFDALQKYIFREHMGQLMVNTDVLATALNGLIKAVQAARREMVAVQLDIDPDTSTLKITYLVAQVGKFLPTPYVATVQLVSVTGVLPNEPLWLCARQLKACLPAGTRGTVTLGWQNEHMKVHGKMERTPLTIQHPDAMVRVSLLPLK